MVKMDRYINQEETLRALLGNSQQQQQPSTEKPKKKKNPEPIQDAGPGEYKKVKKNFGDYKWTPLNASLTEVLMELKKKSELPEAETHSRRSTSTLGSQILCLP
jgi:hypothetical protein